MESIREWLNGSRNYDTGVALYDCYGDDKGLKAAFAQGHSEYRQKRLVTELTALITNSESVKVSLPETEKVTARVVIVTRQREQMPETIVPKEKDPYINEWAPLFAEMNYLRHQLLTVDSDEKRGEMAFRILELEDSCYYWWEKRDYLLQYGHEKPDNKPIPDIRANKNEWEKRLRTVRTYITKLSKQGKKEQLDRYIAERDDLEQKLGYERPDTERKPDTSTAE